MRPRVVSAKKRQFNNLLILYNNLEHEREIYENRMEIAGLCRVPESVIIMEAFFLYAA